MKTCLKRGSVFLPLLLALSISGFILVKVIALNSFNLYQSEVASAVDDRYDPKLTRYALSEFVGPINTWDTYTDKNYGYSIKYPKVWVNTLQTENPKQQPLAIFEASLANKIKLTVNVKKSFEIPKGANKIKMGANIFYLYEDSQHQKAAALEHKKLFFEIILYDNNYFANEPELRGAFYQILKNFEFVN